MKPATVLTWAVLVCVLWGPPVSADPPLPCPYTCGPQSCPWLRGCPDDYCRKPQPAIHCLRCGGPDDYCRKPLPPCYCLPCGGPDDYCRKPCPPACRPMDTSYYSCGNVGRPACGVPAWLGPLLPTRPEGVSSSPDPGDSRGAPPVTRPTSPYVPR